MKFRIVPHRRDMNFHLEIYMGWEWMFFSRGFSRWAIITRFKDYENLEDNIGAPLLRSSDLSDAIDSRKVFATREDARAYAHEYKALVDSKNHAKNSDEVARAIWWDKNGHTEYFDL